MINVQEVILDPDMLPDQPFTILRSQGQFVMGGFQSVTTEIQIWGPVQQASNKEIMMLPEADRVAPLITHKVTKASLRQWLREQRVDCVILSHDAFQLRAWIDELGYEVPGKLGVCLATLYGPCEGLAGIDIQLDLIGETAVRSVVSMLQQNERGLPPYPRYVTVEGRWVDRPSVRPRPSARVNAQSSALAHQMV